MDTLNGQVALVTGSSRGIGAAIAAELARRGAAVAVHGRDGDAVAAVTAQVNRDGGKAIGVTGDLTDFASVEAVRRRVESETRAPPPASFPAAAPCWWPTRAAT